MSARLHTILVSLIGHAMTETPHLHTTCFLAGWLIVVLPWQSHLTCTQTYVFLVGWLIVILQCSVLCVSVAMWLHLCSYCWWWWWWWYSSRLVALWWGHAGRPPGLHACFVLPCAADVGQGDTEWDPGPNGLTFGPGMTTRWIQQNATTSMTSYPVWQLGFSGLHFTSVISQCSVALHVKCDSWGSHLRVRASERLSVSLWATECACERLSVCTLHQNPMLQRRFDWIPMFVTSNTSNEIWLHACVAFKYWNICTCMCYCRPVQVSLLHTFQPHPPA